MDKYLVCEKKKNRPQVSVKVCRNCRYRFNCRVYNDYLQPLLFPAEALRVPDHVYRKRKNRFKGLPLLPEKTS
ncbi:MAG: hypothetical protein ACE5GM_00445 [bacterium]